MWLSFQVQNSFRELNFDTIREILNWYFRAAVGVAVLFEHRISIVLDRDNWSQTH